MLGCLQNCWRIREERKREYLVDFVDTLGHWFSSSPSSFNCGIAPLGWSAVRGIQSQIVVEFRSRSRSRRRFMRESSRVIPAILWEDLREAVERFLRFERRQSSDSCRVVEKGSRAIPAQKFCWIDRGLKENRSRQSTILKRNTCCIQSSWGFLLWVLSLTEVREKRTAWGNWRFEEEDLLHLVLLQHTLRKETLFALSFTIVRTPGALFQKERVFTRSGFYPPCITKRNLKGY